MILSQPTLSAVRKLFESAQSLDLTGSGLTALNVAVVVSAVPHEVTTGPRGILKMSASPTFDPACSSSAMDGAALLRIPFHIGVSQDGLSEGLLCRSRISLRTKSHNIPLQATRALVEDHVATQIGSGSAAAVGTF